MSKQRLKLDLEAMFPGDTLTIGDSTIHIRPLSLFQLTKITKTLKSLGAILSECGVTWDNYNQPENLVKMATVLLDQFPNVLSEASNIEVEDLHLLPPEIIVEILDKVIEVNLASKETLEGNFKSLIGKFQLLTPKEQEERVSLKRSRS